MLQQHLQREQIISYQDQQQCRWIAHPCASEFMFTLKKKNVLTQEPLHGFKQGSCGECWFLVPDWPVHPKAETVIPFGQTANFGADQLD